MIYSRRDRKTIHLTIPYHTIRAAVIKEENIMIMADEQAWYDDHRRKYKKIFIPEGSTHYLKTYAFFKDVVKINQQNKALTS